MCVEVEQADRDADQVTANQVGGEGAEGERNK